jgi:hypothetical protein
MLHKQSDVSRLVDRLVTMEYVEKKEDELNKRRLRRNGQNSWYFLDVYSKWTK